MRHRNRDWPFYQRSCNKLVKLLRHTPLIEIVGEHPDFKAVYLPSGKEIYSANRMALQLLAEYAIIVPMQAGGHALFSVHVDGREYSGRRNRKSQTWRWIQGLA
jgi:hypothetical protein